MDKLITAVCGLELGAVEEEEKDAESRSEVIEGPNAAGLG